MIAVNTIIFLFVCSLFEMILKLLTTVSIHNIVVVNTKTTTHHVIKLIEYSLLACSLGALCNIRYGG